MTNASALQDVDTTCAVRECIVIKTWIRNPNKLPCPVPNLCLSSSPDCTHVHRARVTQQESFNAHDGFAREARRMNDCSIQMHSTSDQHTKKKFSSDPLCGVSRLIFVDGLGAL
jgi:hypothetical protein